MGAAFGSLMVGWVLLISAVQNRPVLDVIRGVAGTSGGGPGSGFLKAILPAQVGSSTAGGGNGAAGAPAGPAGPAGTGSRPANPSGIVNFEGTPVCAWIADELRKARANGWTGTVNSGYRSAADQARVCAQTSNPCAAPGTSNHQGRRWPSCAVDVNDAAGLERALPKGSPLKFTGRAINDMVHFSSGLSGV